MTYILYTRDTTLTVQTITAEPGSYTTNTSPTISNTTSPSILQNNPHRRLSAHAQADAARAMRHTDSWTPIERRQSWSREDQKHELQMTGIKDTEMGPGFTESGG
ncbi:hypothetical protein BGZ61DRAFT_143995 [Ilyonectria robusta]|uniref:uncharacterized protein n=1 Tax=Ilyonectria robusta TaxID=1079257 RepID=UPI001E8D4E3E|nr:uncharacterized protein BGZ61DRAFT_143995 [Ilyonectria robusta]KAH8662695.1 hypothetical protein BGZ61DRAFT_143995 [Ilyonectria robusta]